MAMWKRLFALGALLVGLLFVMSLPSRAVVSGDYVLKPQTEVPWILSIWVAPNEEIAPKFICSASLIEPQLILTAAHCFQGISGTFFVEYGAKKLGQGTLVPIDAYWVSPRYNRLSIVNDVAIAHTLVPIPSSTFPRLDTSNLSGRSGSRATVYGWGADQNGETTGDLRKSNLLFSPSSASRFFGKNFNSRTNLAAGRYISSERIYTAACNGDSGGPLVIGSNSRPVIVGVVSYGPAESCNTKIPTVFSRVSYYKSDIAKGKEYVLDRSETDPIAPPMNLTEPEIVGVLKPDSRVTCDKGTWTNNAVSYKIKWFQEIEEGSYEELTPSSDGSIILTRDLFSGGIWCQVVASSTTRNAATASRVQLPDVPAEIQVISHGDNAEISGETEIEIDILSGSKAGDEISSFCVLLNGKPYESNSDKGCYRASGSESFKVELDATQYADGPITLEVTATTASRVPVPPKRLSLVVKNDPPTVSFIEPAANSTISGRFTLQGSAKPSSKGTASIARVCLLLNGKLLDQGYYRNSWFISNNQNSSGCITDSSQSPEWNFDTTDWANGSYEFSFSAIDSSGRSSETIKRTFIKN